MQKKEYLHIMIRLIPFVIPKATEVPTNEPAERKPLSWFSGGSLSQGDLPSNHHEKLSDILFPVRASLVFGTGNPGF
jgi:hypothetical protein